MTRKDFQLVVDCILEASRFVPQRSEQAAIRMAFHDKLKASYPAFDSDRFFMALGDYVEPGTSPTVR